MFQQHYDGRVAMVDCHGIYGSFHSEMQPQDGGIQPSLLLIWGKAPGMEHSPLKC